MATCWERVCCRTRGSAVATDEGAAAGGSGPQRVESVNPLDTAAQGISNNDSTTMRPARMNHDFEGVEESEVTVAKNTIVQVIEDDSENGPASVDGWSYVICPNGSAGYVPAAFFTFT